MLYIYCQIAFENFCTSRFSLRQCLSDPVSLCPLSHWPGWINFLFCQQFSVLSWKHQLFICRRNLAFLHAKKIKIKILLSPNNPYANSLLAELLVASTNLDISRFSRLSPTCTPAIFSWLTWYHYFSDDDWKVWDVLFLDHMFWSSEGTLVLDNRGESPPGKYHGRRSNGKRCWLDSATGRVFISRFFS